MNFHNLSAHLKRLLDSDPAEAVRQARQIDIQTPENQINARSIRAAILVDGGSATRQPDAIQEGLELFREVYEAFPDVRIAYNLANALVASAGNPPRGSGWLDHQERTREQRAEARRLFWMVAHENNTLSETRTQAWTNIANQFTNSFRLSEAHDARLSALKVDPTNGVAAGAAARDLLWLFENGIGSDLTRIEAIMMAKIAKQNTDRVRKFAGERAVKEYSALSDSLDESPQRSAHKDPFVRWVEQERLTLAPTVELVDPELGKLDWLMLPGIMERNPGGSAVTPPPIFAMFNVLKADFILARDLAWRAKSDAQWPETGRFSDTLDYSTYGPSGAALVLAHRIAIDLLDKVAVTANHYFEIGKAPDKVYFGRLWRQEKGGKTRFRPLISAVEKAIRGGSKALYGLVELSEDYEKDDGILRPQKNLRNAGTHRFVVLHDFGGLKSCRSCPEIEHHNLDSFSEEAVRALRIARSAIQMLTFAIAQQERQLGKDTPGFIGTMDVPDHDWIRGKEDE